MERLSDIKDIPWTRIAHFYGRATDVGAAVVDLNSDHHREAEHKLRECLEHQDGVIQATPVAAYFMIEMLKNRAVRDPGAVISILKLFQSSALYQLSLSTQVDAADWDSVLGKEQLLPAFIDDDTERGFWEERWDPGAASDAWAKLTYDLIANALGEN